ncbi:TPA: hypothetical protein N0F65_004636 [Lagenidium giganteum]|uniref:Uncharacterized protein n=1 Tax=Lagenidium giganteum TaxID=4803 RepID=A0AAV2ZDI4_9STRA|nr:TPA: hypothetical protein N0F65_004636 [Lagenidium giganteum]
MRICSCCFFAYRKKLDESSDDVAAAVAVPAPATALPVVAAEISTDAIAVPATLVDDDNNKHVNDLLNCARNTEEELEAVRHAKELEKQVAASRERIQELEGRIASHEELQRQAKLSLEQQAQLRDARAMIQSLQAQLREQEESAQEAVRTRDTLCLSKMRQTEVFSNDDDESRALKQKLRVLERQLQQAGINVAEVIPYDVARAKVTEISRAMAAIGSSEVVLVDKQAQTKARKQYYILEQQMEKYNTALLMTDEYVAEQARIQAAWEAQHAATNARSAQLLRGAMPVEIARLSEHDLRTMKTPSGVPFPPDLARRLKRTNVLQLLRVDPTTITKMHPSVITNLRTNGLSLLERRALHHALLKPSKDWAKQQKEELSARKYAWFTKLKEALAQGLRSLEAHCQGLDIDVYADDISHVCSAVGTACPVRAEQKVLQLYACGLGFSMDEVFAAQEILKSDAEGAGEKARLEAQAHAREMVTNHRQRELKKHYRTNMRLVALALGALEEADALRERVVATDDSFITLDDDRDKLQSVTTLLQDSRELLWLLAKRAGICLTGKRDPTRDSEDDRSELEGQAAMDAVAMLTLVVEDVQGFLASHRASAGACVGMLQAVKQLLQDVDAKNTALNERLGEQGGPGGVPTPMPTSAKMFDAIRARRKSVDKRDGPVVASSPAIPRANDLFAAIRARKKAAAAAASSNVEAALAQSA